MSKIICFASAKGGSGKTALTASIGAFLAGIGKRVLLIDTDAATNGLTLLYIREVLATQAPFSVGMFDEGDHTSSLTPIRVATGADLLPASFSFRDSEQYPIEGFRIRLRSAVRQMRQEYDFIILDAQAGADEYAAEAMHRDVSDAVVIVSEYDPMSAAGIERLKGLLREDLTYGRTWVLLNKVLPEFAKSFSDFLEVARYLSPIPWDADVVRAYARRRLALDMENGNPFTLALVQVVKTIYADELESEIEAWIDSRAAQLRAPVQEQYRDLERQLAAIMFNTKTIELARERYVAMQSILTFGMMAAVLATVSVFLLRLYGRTSFFGLERDWSLVIGAAGVALSTVALFPWMSLIGKRRRSISLEVEKARLARRREVLEENLRRLEVLRAADPETLLRSGERNPRLTSPYT